VNLSEKTRSRLLDFFLESTGSGSDRNPLFEGEETRFLVFTLSNSFISVHLRTLREGFAYICGKKKTRSCPNFQENSTAKTP